MKIIRWLLTFVILFLDRLTSPRPPRREADDQLKLDERTRALRLYEFRGCPFCVKVRREIRRLGLNIQTVDVEKPGKDRTELETLGGEIQVPCLRIPEPGTPDRWMYESDAIIAYLRKTFA